MSSFVRHKIDVLATQGKTFPSVTCWLPFDGAVFAAQKHLTIERLWQVVHVPTTFLIPTMLAACDTRAEALIIARRLSVECPAARQVFIGGDRDMVGPVDLMKSQILASLREAA